MYEHLDPKQRARIQELERRTVHTMNDTERAEYNALIAPVPIIPIVPPGQNVEEIFNTVDPGLQRNPYIGLWVTYYSRPGEGREAKTRFPAMVMETHGIDSRTGRWLVKLAVHYNATESTDIRCLQRTEADRFGVWDYAEDPYWSIINILNRRLEAVEEKLTQLNGAPRPPKPGR